MTRSQLVARVTLAVLLSGVAALIAFMPKVDGAIAYPALPQQPEKRTTPRVADPFTSPSDLKLTYTGPEDKRSVAAAGMDVLQRHCFRIIEYLNRFGAVSVAYIELPDQEQYGAMAGFRTVTLSFTWKTGAWPPGAPHEKAADFILIGGPGRGITTGGSGAWLCNQVVPRGKTTVFIRAPDISLSDP